MGWKSSVGEPDSEMVMSEKVRETGRRTVGESWGMMSVGGVSRVECGVIRGECGIDGFLVLESRLRQASEQYRMLLLGVTICFSQVALFLVSGGRYRLYQKDLPELEEARHVVVFVKLRSAADLLTPARSSLAG